MSRAKIVEPLAGRLTRKYKDAEGAEREVKVTVGSLVSARARRSKKKIVVRLKR